MNRGMNVSVVLCTYNRCKSLARTLRSIAASESANYFEWEVVVVDNNSTDDTRVVVDEFSRQYPGRFRYLFEPRQGKSYALNSGVRSACGQVIAFLDDDVIIEPTWLMSITSSLQTGDWAGAGGRTLLDQPFSPPSWLSLKYPGGHGGIVAALFDFGESPGELKVAPYGTNMAYRKEMFERHGLFRTDLGPSPSRRTPRPNEDTEFGRRLMAAGERICYEPSAVVYHGVTEERLHKKYYLDWWFDYGRALIREKGVGDPICGFPRHYFGIPKMITITLPVFALRWMRTMNSAERFFAKCLTWSIAGQIAETSQIAREMREKLRSDEKNRFGNYIEKL
jgi:glucosyl-dolichyl phosphate glucuronosyltransferase